MEATVAEPTATGAKPTITVETVTRPTLSHREAAAYLGIHENTLHLHVEIPRLRIGGRVLYRRETLDRFLAESEQSGIDLSRKGPKRCRK
jgi:excisionase family DNA binding protein